MRTAIALAAVLFTLPALAQVTPPAPQLQVQSAGTAVTKRSKINFSTGCTAADNSGQKRTDVTCAGTGVPTTRTLTTTSPVRCDGGASCDLSANRTLSLTSSSVTIKTPFSKEAFNETRPLKKRPLPPGIMSAGMLA